MNIKYLIIAFVIVLCGVMFSCDDFLTEDAKGLITSDNFLNNEEEANLALNGLQGQMPYSSGCAEYPGLVGGSMSSILGTDIGVCGRFAIAAKWENCLYNYTSDDSYVACVWADQYAGVRDANLLIACIEESSLSDEIKGQTKAQALFYRAMFYFQLTVGFGDVPYWRDEVDVDEVSMLGKTSSDSIQEDMIEDLDWAISSGYLSEDKWNDNGGRPTVWSARMLKAYFYVWMEQWTEASVELKEITDNSPHTTLSDYADMYREGNETHDELIFGREFLAGTDNNKTFQMAHYNSSAENDEAILAMEELDVFSRSAAMTLRKSFTDTYSDNDLRKDYSVFDSYTLSDSTEASVFNWVYIPKLMRAALPISDPLMDTPDANGLSSEPVRLFKLADALLLLSEAEFMENGSTTDALEPINRVRARAGLDALDVLTIEDIRKERAWELGGEGFFGHKYDLIRWGILESTVMATPSAERAAGAYSLAISRAEDDSTNIANAVSGKFCVMPIPADEILKSQDVGGALVQNPLWE
jgi:hypothetical protein